MSTQAEKDITNREKYLKKLMQTERKIERRAAKEREQKEKEKLRKIIFYGTYVEANKKLEASIINDPEFEKLVTNDRDRKLFDFELKNKKQANQNMNSTLDSDNDEENPPKYENED